MLLNNLHVVFVRGCFTTEAAFLCKKRNLSLQKFFLLGGEILLFFYLQSSQMKNIGWDDIRNEYISTNISYRKLAAKYGVSERTLTKKAIREQWVALREQRGSKSIQKTIEKTSDKAAERAANLMTATDKVLRAILKDIEKIEAADVPYNWKNVTAALKDIKEIQSASEDKQQNILVKLQTELEEWSE